MRPWLARRLVNPLLLGLRGEPVGAQLAELRASASGDPESVVADQLAAFRAVATAGRERFPFFAELLERQGADPAAVRAPGDLTAWPVTGKEDLRRAAEILRRGGGLPRHTVRLSGGSTGLPSVVLADRHTTGRSLAARVLCQGWHGLAPGDRQIRFWGRPLDEGAWREGLKDRVLNRIRLDSLALGSGALAGTLDRIERFGAEFLYGYASLIRMFVESLDEGQAAALRKAGLKAVVSTSEVLPDPQRRALSDRLGVPVVDEYGCSETDIMAFMCPEGNRHVVAANVLVEVVRQGDEPAGYGRVVVTDLTNRLMPVVRYGLGDLAPLEAPVCGCGCGWPCLGPVLGRIQGQFIVRPDGERVHSQFVVYLVEQLVDEGLNIARFRIRQESAQGMTLLVVPGAGDPPDTGDLRQRLEDGARPALGRDMTWQVRLVDASELEAAGSGKARHFEGIEDGSAGS